MLSGIVRTFSRSSAESLPDTVEAPVAIPESVDSTVGPAQEVRAGIAGVIAQPTLADDIRQDRMKSVLAEGSVGDTEFALVAVRLFCDSDIAFKGKLEVHLRENGAVEMYDFEPACLTLKQMEARPGATELLEKFEAAHDVWLEKNTATNRPRSDLHLKDDPMPGIRARGTRWQDIGQSSGKP